MIGIHAGYRRSDNVRIVTTAYRSTGIVALVSLAGLSVAYGEANDTPMPDRVGLIASNHSVALDDLEERSAPAGMSPDGIEGTDRPRRGIASGASVVTLRKAKRRSDAADPSAPAAGIAAPWYRTGLGALAVVLALIGLVYVMARRWIPAARAADNGALRILGRTSLSGKHHLSLVQVGRRVVMIGMSPDRVTALCEINDPDEVVQLVTRTGATNPYAFDEELFREAAGYQERPDEESTGTPSRRGGALRPSDSLKDLLRRLRTSQSK